MAARVTCAAAYPREWEAEGEAVVHLDELWNMAVQIFSTDDWVRLVIIAVIVIAGGFFMSSFGQLLNTTVLALIVFVIATMVRAEMAPDAPDFGTLLQQDWDTFLAMDVKTLLVWFLSFAVLIAIVHGIRSLVFRG
jgi:hypothetical protein